ncbi:PAAR domain-containing protein [Pseudomonas sp. URMO17WK12:I11]|uniref:PAAR domain-containing protein n=1 Tax=Pseudomonas sp. URMO17WK12:I11 TaxID=1283291 RepID=UPI0011A9314D|nr:PAAR domain-containing protein [Pseudomonas sp. URMO17WK12:I11]
MKSIVLIGHAHGCPLHVAGTVESGASTTFVNGRAVARVGDRTSFGAIIETGANCLLIEGQPAAMKVEV